jgi:anti-sigma factor RsiW
MNHPHDDQLLLLAYGELPAPEVGAVEAHVADCATCRAQLAQLETAHALLDVALPPRRRRPLRWFAGAALAAAALLAGVWLMSWAPVRRVTPGWRPTSQWSATAGYVTGVAMVDIDAQLTRLEQERYYGRP